MESVIKHFTDSGWHAVNVYTCEHSQFTQLFRVLLNFTNVRES